MLKYEVVFDIVFYFLGIEKPSVATKLNLTLSADHRVFDGKVGGMCYLEYLNLPLLKWKVGKFDYCYLHAFDSVYSVQGTQEDILHIQFYIQYRIKLIYVV